MVGTTIKRLIKLAISLIVRGYDLLWLGLTRIVGIPLPARCVVLYYHSIPADQRVRFARQMDELLRLARPISVAQLENLDPNVSTAVVTFDDGFVSVLENAYPELKERQIPFTIFVPSGCLGQGPSWIRNGTFKSTTDRVMTAEELRSLAGESIVSIGSHSVNHTNLLRLSPELANWEFARSKADLEAIFTRPVNMFSYPYGAHSSKLHQQARQTGYTRIFTSEPSIVLRDSIQFITGRVSVDIDDWPIEFRLKVKGAYRWGSSLQVAKRQIRAWMTK